MTDLQAAAGASHFVEANGVRLHYLEAGTGPTLVFVPGWTMPAEVWEPQIRHFAATHRAVALDPRGHGRSEKPAHGYYPLRRGQDIGELLEHLGGEPAVVVSWSLGVLETLVYVGEQLVAAAAIGVADDWQPDGQEPCWSLLISSPDLHFAL